MPIRNIHLDFHTSEHIQNIGYAFNKKEFQNTFLKADVESVTLFAKCHHGWCYYPSKVGVMHPNLNFNLLKQQIEALKEVGIKAIIYITMGWSELDADNHNNWRAVDIKQNYVNINYDEKAKPTDEKPYTSWRLLCPVNKEYKKYLLDLTQEICDMFDDFDGLFFDICTIGPCSCRDCSENMKKEGLNPLKYDNSLKYFIKARKELFFEIKKILFKKNKNASLFFNGTAVHKWKDFHEFNTHFELENLPSTTGDFDKLTLEANYFKSKSKKVIGMTAKFLNDWGEFGSYKTSKSLQYECFRMIIEGAGCCIGDQLDPSGKLDEATYKIIGETFAKIKKYENYFVDATEMTSLAIFMTGNEKFDMGALKLLSDSQIDFSIIDDENKIFNYTTIIVPDIFNPIDETIWLKFINDGGNLILSGEIIVSDEFSRIAQISATEKSQDDCDYICLSDKNILMHNSGYIMKNNISKDKKNKIISPLFTRTYEHFCSHRNTPYDASNILLNNFYEVNKFNNIIYFAHSFFEEYYYYSDEFIRNFYVKEITKIFKPIIIKSSLPKGARIKFNTKEKNKIIFTINYATMLKTEKVFIAKDFPILAPQKIVLNIDKKIDKVYIPLKCKNVIFKQKENIVELTLPKLEMFELIIMEIKNE